jgi:hypothetical protein
VTRPERAVLAVFVSAKLLVHLLFNGGYGVFRDELYYLACADHLAWGYVDHPPLVAVFAAVARALFGTSAFGLRVLPAVAGAAVVALTWAVTRELGGRTFAQAVACACVLAAPELLGTHSFLSMNVLEHVFWIAAVFVVVRATARERPRVLLWLGPIVGLGFLDKHSMAWLVGGLVFGLLATPERRWLTKRETAIAAAVALLIALPHVVWQLEHGFPTLEFMRNAQEQKNVHLPALAFWKQLTDSMNLMTAPVWLAGLAGLLVRRDLARWRFLGIATLLVFALVTWQKGKTYYLSPSFAALYAAGGVVLERLTAERPAWLRRARWAVLAPIALNGAVAAPFALPILSPDAFVAYARRLGFEPDQSERSEQGPLPQFFADRFGWREMSEAVRAAYASLSPEERTHAAILARNYGEASAVRFYAPPGDTTPVLSTHNSYYLWGYGDPPPDTLVTIGFGRPRLEAEFEDVREVGRFSHPLAMPYESDNPIFVCRRPRRPFAEIWRSYKLFI